MTTNDVLTINDSEAETLYTTFLLNSLPTGETSVTKEWHDKEMTIWKNKWVDVWNDLKHTKKTPNPQNKAGGECLKICSLHFKMVSQIREEYLVRIEDEASLGPTLSTQLKEHIKTRKHECLIKKVFHMHFWHRSSFKTKKSDTWVEIQLDWCMAHFKKENRFLMFLMLTFWKWTMF